MDREESSRARMIDAHIDELVQEVQQGQRLADAPELRMAYDIRRAYQAETLEDVRSLERVLARLRGDQAVAQSQVLFLPHGSQQQERLSLMHHRIDTLARGKTSSGWQQHVGVLAGSSHSPAFLRTC